MVIVYSSFTTPVNPPGVLPVLSHAQLWKAMQRKVRYAHEFVPAFSSCEVQSEDIDPDNEGGLIVHRTATFKEGQGPPGLTGSSVKEVVKSYEPTRVDFHQEDGSVIQNIISEGIDVDGEKALYLTYVLEYRYPGMERGGHEHREKETGTQKVRPFRPCK